MGLQLFWRHLLSFNGILSSFDFDRYDAPLYDKLLFRHDILPQIGFVTMAHGWLLSQCPFVGHQLELLLPLK